MSAAKRTSSTAKPDYASLRQELNDIVVRLQSTEVDVDDAMAAYKRGVDIIAQLETYLTKAEHTITLLDEQADDMQED